MFDAGVAGFDPPFVVAAEAAAPFPPDPLGVEAGVASLPEPPLRALTSLNTPGGLPPVPAAPDPLSFFPFPEDAVAVLEPDAPDAAVSPAATLRDLAGGEEMEGELPAPFLEAEAPPPPPLPEGGRPRRFSPDIYESNALDGRG